MEKKSKKELEKNLVAAVEQILKTKNGNATVKISKVIKGEVKIIVKKFSKAYKESGKKAIKKKEDSAVTPVKIN